MKRKPCGRATHLGACSYERLPGKQRCIWHYAEAQPIGIQVQFAGQRLADAIVAGGGPGTFVRRQRVPEAEWPAGERWCSGCQSFVPFWYCQGSRCRPCSSQAAHERRLEKTYGITPAEYDALFELQGGRCYVCRRQTKKRLAVDHDHKTGEVRGLLCANNERGCNHAVLGTLEGSVDGALAAAKRVVEYLEYPPMARLRDEAASGAPDSDASDPWADWASTSP